MPSPRTAPRERDARLQDRDERILPFLVSQPLVARERLVGWMDASLDPRNEPFGLSPLPGFAPLPPDRCFASVARVAFCNLDPAAERQLPTEIQQTIQIK